MKLIISGKPKEFTPELEEKFSSKLAKLGKFIERRGEREAHVCHSMERHLHKVEVIVNFYDYSLIAEGADSDLETALSQSLEKLEKQIVKVRNRWRDTRRDAKGTRSNKENWNGEGAPTEVAAAKAPPAPKPAAKRPNGSNSSRARVFRVNFEEDRKPMTVEEAMIEMEQDVDYVVYRDSVRNCLSVLIRRADGNFDLIES
jgi:putative sigma-54 modulation protein